MSHCNDEIPRNPKLFKFWLTDFHGKDKAFIFREDWGICCRVKSVIAQVYSQIIFEFPRRRTRMQFSGIGR